MNVVKPPRNRGGFTYVDGVLLHLFNVVLL